MSSPNDFDVKTLFDLIESGFIKIPGFQRNYVWDIQRASKLIESLIIGLPVPQIFLYEEGRDTFLVIDGQQRLLTIYYYIKGRFPRKEMRGALHRIVLEEGHIPDEVFEDEHYFTDFRLKLPGRQPGQRNKYNGLFHADLGIYKSAFDHRSIRCIVVTQVSPDDDDSAIYEIFNRLNTGGVQLRQQEIRMSLYHSDFYELLYRLNNEERWRRFLDLAEPDPYMKDMEFLLRSFAFLINGDSYQPLMVKFLNRFSHQAKNSFKKSTISYLETLFRSFLASSSMLGDEAFDRNNRFSYILFESVFVAVCKEPYQQEKLVSGKIDPESVAQLRSDHLFLRAMQGDINSKEHVSTRLRRASEIIQLY